MYLGVPCWFVMLNPRLALYLSSCQCRLTLYVNSRSVGWSVLSLDLSSTFLRILFCLLLGFFQIFIGERLELEWYTGRIPNASTPGSMCTDKAKI